VLRRRRVLGARLLANSPVHNPSSGGWGYGGPW